MTRDEGAGATPGFGTVGILGLGLLGGSLAREMSARGVRVLGYDRDAATLDAARAAGIVHEALDASLDRLGAAEIIIVAVPVSSLRDVLASAVARIANARLIMDVGSTKRSAIAAAESLGVGDRFVGSHPMAGDHRSGWQASRRGLFAGATVYLCCGNATRDESLALAREFWSALGAHGEVIDAGAHDHRVAYASHLPHLLATGLGLALADAAIPRGALGPGGRDATRLAASSPEMWTAIALDNADNVLPALTALESQIGWLREAIERGDDGALRTLLTAASTWAVKDST